VAQGVALACPAAVPGGGCAVFQGNARSVVTLAFSEPMIDSDPATGQSFPRQGLVAILRVSDNPATGADCSSLGPVLTADRFSPTIDTAGYQIECDRTDPIAQGPPNTTVTCTTTPCNLSVSLSSRDDESGIETYRWDCGNGQVFTGSATATCTYTLPDIYTAQLTVINRCGDDAIDNVTVDVNAAP
jgi:hypothetical protein